MGWLSKLRSHFREEQLHRELDDEMQAHLDLRVRDNIAEGMTPEDARRAALRSFGNVTLLTERARDAEMIRWLDTAWQNLRYAVRALRKSPGSTAAAVASIAIGIGATTAIFALMNAVLFKTLPVPNPEQVVALNYDSPHAPAPSDDLYSIEAYRALRDGASRYIDLWAFVGAQPILRYGSTTALVTVTPCSGNYYTALEAHPYLGRLIGPSDDTDSDARKVVVLTYRAWLRMFGGDPTIVGRPVELNRTPFLVIGVEPESYSDSPISATTDAVVPYAAGDLVTPDVGGPIAFPSGRVRSGVSLQQAEAALNAIYHRLQPDWNITLEPALGTLPYLRDRYRKALQVLMGAVVLVLLIACTNVANLLLARGAARRRELAVRVAIGAGRARIAMQLLTESLLLSLCGAALGVALAYFGDAALLSILRSPVRTLPIDIHPDARVLAFTAGVAVLTGLLFGLFPALQAIRIDVNPALKEGARESGGRHRFFVRRGLILVQVALSLMLLTSAGLFASGLRNLRTMDSGYDRRGVLLATVNAVNSHYSPERTLQFFNQLLAEVREIPGLETAALAGQTVLGGSAITIPLQVEGKQCMTSMTSVTDGYIETMRIGLVAGRTFTPADLRPGAPLVVMVNQALERACFGGENPVGRKVRVGKDFEVAGVVRDAKYQELREGDRPMLYIPPVPGLPILSAGMDLHVRTSIDPKFLIAPLRRELAALNPMATLDDVRTLEEQSDRSLSRERMLAMLSEAFGAIALVLAVVGIYGVLAFLVTQRTAEIGIRMALGAQRRQVVGLVLRESVALVTAGAAVGAWGAHVSRRLIQSLLYGVDASDERATVVAALVLTAAALAASLLPARRASRVDPITALRQE